MTIVRPGSVYPFPDNRRTSEESSQPSDTKSDTQPSQRDSQAGVKAELHIIYRPQDLNPIGTVKASAEPLCWSMMLERSSWAAGSEIETVWTRQDGKSFLAAQTLC